MFTKYSKGLRGEWTKNIDKKNNWKFIHFLIKQLPMKNRSRHVLQNSVQSAWKFEVTVKSENWDFIRRKKQHQNSESETKTQNRSQQKWIRVKCHNSSFELESTGKMGKMNVLFRWAISHTIQRILRNMWHLEIHFKWVKFYELQKLSFIADDRAFASKVKTWFWI